MNFEHFSKKGDQIYGWDGQKWVPTEQEVAVASKARRKKSIADSMWGGLDVFNQGLTLGAADEVQAAVGALPALMPGGENFGDAYTRRRDALRARAEQFKARNPNTAMGLEALGGTITGAVTGGAGLGGPAVSVGRNLAQAATLGGTEGYIAGLMSSDDKDLDDALASGGFGALVGLAGPSIASALGGGGQLAARVGRALSMPPEAKARREARDLLEQMGMDQETFAVRMRNVGPDAVFADVSEAAAQQLRTAAAGNPRVMHAAQATLEPRAAGGRDRVLGAAQKEMNPQSDVRLTDEITKLDETRRAQARQDYPDVYAQTPPMSKDLERIIRNPRVRDAFKEAQRLRSYDLDAPPLPELYAVRDDGSIDIAEYPTVEMWDDIKRGLDTIVERHTNEFGRVDTEGREAVRLKNRMLSSLDKEVDGYANARQRYAGTSALMGAVRNGSNIFKEEAEISRDALGDMTDNEREAFKIGAFNAVRDEIESTRLMGTPAARQKFASEKYMRRLRHAFDDDKSFGRFRSQLERELNMQRTRNTALYGSDTARTLLSANEMGQNMLDPTMMTSPEGFVAGIGRRVMDELGDTPRREMASSIYGRGLLAPLDEALQFVQTPTSQAYIPQFPPGTGTGALIGGSVTGTPDDLRSGMTSGLLGY